MLGFFNQSEIQSRKPETDLVPKCGACGLYRVCKTPKMRPWGKGRRRILIVGEAPGETEDELGRPFAGKAGQFLQSAIESLGLDFRRDLLITNAAICRPPGNKFPKGGKEIEYCRPNLLRTISEFQPAVIIPLGRHALRSVMEPVWKSNLGPLERWAGFRIPLQSHWVCPTWHPSYLLRRHDTMLDRLFREHLRAAVNPDRDPDGLEIPDDAIEILYEEWQIKTALRDMDREGSWVAVDYETNCVKPEYDSARIWSLAVSNGKRTISFPWFGSIPAIVSRFLRSKRTRKIASNLKFEERWTLKHLGHGVRNWGWDTMVAAHVIDNRPGICSLKFQALVRLGVPSYNETVAPFLDTKSGSHLNRIDQADPESLLRYGGMDALLEWHLAKIQRRDFGIK